MGIDPNCVKALLNINDNGDAEAYAAIANIYHVVKDLHDPNSRFMEMLLNALADGKLCIVDMSLYGSNVALSLSGIVLDYIFHHNQAEFTKANSQAIPTIAVLEEAQSVLTPGKGATAPFIAWVKEGRKYDLGALMITQQPGSLSTDILSQGDNWFVFHLLSDKDLLDVKRANAHFSNDLLSSLLNEPIVGQGVFWSSVPTKRGVKPYPIPLRVFSFQDTINIVSDEDKKGPIDNYVQKLIKDTRDSDNIPDATPVDGLDNQPGEPFVSPPTREDNLAEQLAAIFSQDVDFMSSFIRQGYNRGHPWGTLMGEIREKLPSSIKDKESLAKKLVKPVVVRLFGEEHTGWATIRENTNAGKPVTFIYKLIPDE